MTYKEELELINQEYQKAHGPRSFDVIDFDEKGQLTEIGARNLHAELCRLYGMTYSQIIENWNKKSPDDPW